MDLTPEVKTKVLNRFTAFWATVKDSPHFDEFFVLLTDLPGVVVSFHGCISVHFGEFFQFAGCTEGVTQEQRSVIDGAKQAFGSLQTPLPPSNASIGDSGLCV